MSLRDHIDVTMPVESVRATIGARLKHYRAEAGLTLAEAGAAIGMTGTAVSSYEDGVNELSLRSAIGLCEAYGVPLTRFVGEPLRESIPGPLVGPRLDVLLRAFASYYERRQYAPTVRELQRDLAWSSPNTVHYWLQRAQELGYIEADTYNVARSRRLTEAGLERLHQLRVAA